MSQIKTPEPSRELLRQVKASFVLRGATMGAWCRANGIAQSNAREALVGTWDGPAGRLIRERLCREAGLMSEQLCHMRRAG